MTAYDYFFPSKKKKKLKIKTLLCKLLSCCQALFWKIAADLPGIETLSSTKQEDMVDVNLSLAMQLQCIPNHNQEDVHVDTCYGPMIQLLCPIHNVL